MSKQKPTRKEGGVISHFYSPSKGRKERKLKTICGFPVRRACFTFLCTRYKGTLWMTQLTQCLKAKYWEKVSKLSILKLKRFRQNSVVQQRTWWVYLSPKRCHWQGSADYISGATKFSFWWLWSRPTEQFLRVLVAQRTAQHSSVFQQKQGPKTKREKA